MKRFSQRARDRESTVVIHKATSQFNRQLVNSRRRTKQNSSNSLDSFWAGLDEAEAPNKIPSKRSDVSQTITPTKTLRATEKRRSKQNSSKSLDSFWAGLDDIEFSRQLTGVDKPMGDSKAMKAASFGSSKRSSRVKQLSNQTAKTVKWSVSTTTEGMKEAREVPEPVAIENPPPPVSFITIHKDVAVNPEMQLPEPETKASKKNLFRRIFGAK